MELNYRCAVSDEADLLIDLYNKSFYQDSLRYGECPAYGRTRKQMRQSIDKFSKETILCDDIPVVVIPIGNKGDGDYYLGCLCVIPEYQNKGI